MGAWAAGISPGCPGTREPSHTGARCGTWRRRAPGSSAARRNPRELAHSWLSGTSGWTSCETLVTHDAGGRDCMPVALHDLGCLAGTSVTLGARTCGLLARHPPAAQLSRLTLVSSWHSASPTLPIRARTITDGCSKLVGAEGFEPPKPLACKASALPLSYAPGAPAVCRDTESLLGYRVPAAGGTCAVAVAGVDAEHLGARPLALSLEKRSSSPSA